MARRIVVPLFIFIILDQGLALATARETNTRLLDLPYSAQVAISTAMGRDNNNYFIKQSD